MNESPYLFEYNTSVSIFRVRGLMQSGAMFPHDRPLWYDIYEAFPPKTEPELNRVVAEKTPQQIFYMDDYVRA